VSVLDKKLPEKLAAVFTANPWVAKVRKVQIHYPARVDLDLEYRSPICLVELPGGHGFYPVDASGILLPTEYFTQGTPEENAERMNSLLFVVGTLTNPIGSFGDPWGDPVVEKAAKIADLLGHDAQARGIVSIKILSEPKESLSVNRWDPQPTEFQLITENGDVFHWGTFDFSSENPNEPASKEKDKLELFRK